MNDITNYEYWKEVAELAESILEEAGIKTAEQAEDNRDEIETRLTETIGGHQWVIYYAYNADIIKFSDNESYCEDHFGTKSFEGKSYADIGTIVAEWALYGDVSDKLSELIGELE